MDFKVPAYAAVVSAIITIPSFIVILLWPKFYFSSTIITLAMLITFLSLILGIFIFLGYIKLAMMHDKPIVENLVYVSLFLLIVLTAISVFNLGSEPSLFDFISLLLMGVAYLILGIALFKLKSIFGNTISTISLLYVVSGIIYASVIFVVIIPFIALTISILEAILFFRISKMYD